MEAIDRSPHIVQGVEFQIGGGHSGTSDQNGKVRIKLSPTTMPQTWVTLRIVDQPNRKHYVLVSPFEGRVQVPSFENEELNHIDVQVAVKGDPNLKETAQGVVAVSARVNASISTRTSKERPSKAIHEAALRDASEAFGLTPQEIEQTIKNWGSDSVSWKIIILTAAFNNGRDMFSSVWGEFRWGLFFWNWRVEF